MTIKHGERQVVEQNLQAWSEWSRSNSSGFVSAQWGASGGSEFGSRCLVTPAVDAIERGMRVLHKHDETLQALIKWLWIELNVNRGVQWCAEHWHVSERTFRRKRDAAYAVIYAELKASGLHLAA